MMTPIRPFASTLVGLALLGLACPTGAQKKEAPKPPAWPALSKKDAAEGKKWLGLIHSKKPEIREKAKTTLTRIGLGMGERMFQRFTDTNHRNANEEIAAVLTTLLKPEHATLVGTQAKHKSVFARQFVMRTLARFGRPESIPVFRDGRKDKNVEVAYYAALGLIKTNRDEAALDAVLTRCREEWGEVGGEVTRFLSPCRHKAFTPWIHKQLTNKDVVHRVAVLRMMRSIAPSGASSLIKHLLDSSESILKKETINTLRVIVDGDEPMPLKKITVFRVIKMAKEWKARL